MSAEVWTAIIAGATFLVFLAGTLGGFGAWLSGRFVTLEKNIMTVFREHEKEDNRRFERVNEILMNENLRRDPEFPRRSSESRGH